MLNIIKPLHERDRQSKSKDLLRTALARESGSVTRPGPGWDDFRSLEGHFIINYKSVQISIAECCSLRVRH